MGLYDNVLDPAYVPPPPPAAAQAQPPQPQTPQGSGLYDNVLASTPPEVQQQDQQAQTPGNIVYRSSIFPLSRTDKGTIRWDWNAGIPGSMVQAATLPHRVMTGEVKLPPLGSTDPADYQQIVPEALNFAGTFNPANPAVRAGDRAIPGVARNFQDIRKAPTTADLMETGGRQMDAWYNLPTAWNPHALAAITDPMEQQLIKAGIYRDASPKAYATLDAIRGLPQYIDQGLLVDNASLHSLRQRIGNLFTTEGESPKAAGILKKGLDDFISSPPEGSFVAGHSTAPSRDPGTALFNRALGNLAAGYRGKEFDALNRELDFKAAASAGRNLDLAARNRVNRTVLDEDATRGYIPSEVAGLEGAVFGDKGTNALRSTARNIGGNNDWRSAIAAGVGGTVGGGLGAVLGPYGAAAGTAVGSGAPLAVGQALGSWAAKRTRAAIEAVNEATRQRSPLFREGAPVMAAPSPGSRDAITRAIMAPVKPNPVPALPQLEYDPNRA